MSEQHQADLATMLIRPLGDAAFDRAADGSHLLAAAALALETDDVLVHLFTGGAVNAVSSAW
jgi:hypothetical protein